MVVEESGNDVTDMLFTKNNTNSKIKFDVLEENRTLKKEIIFLKNQLKTICDYCRNNNSSKIRQK